MKQKLRYALQAGGFLAGLVVILFGLSVLFSPKNNHEGFGMDDVTANGILGEKENTIDVLVLGDSEAYTSISPMQIWAKHGFTSYVCATPSQRLFLSQTFLEKAYEKQKPKVVILETNAVYRTIEPGNEFMASVESILPIVRYHNRWKSLNASDFGSSVEFTWTDDNKGFHYNDKVQAVQRLDHMRPSAKAASIPERNQQYVLDMKKYAEERGAKFILLSTPSTKNWNTERHNGMLAFAKANGIEYVDLNLLTKEVPIDWKLDTMDRGDHVNYNGTVKVTKWVGEYLSSLKLLEDHRSDPQFAKWNDVLKRYWVSVGEAGKHGIAERSSDSEKKSEGK